MAARCPIAGCAKSEQNVPDDFRVFVSQGNLVKAMDFIRTLKPENERLKAALAVRFASKRLPSVILVSLCCSYNGLRSFHILDAVASN